MRGRRATVRIPPLPAHRARHPAYFYPTSESMESRVARVREQRKRLVVRKERLSALEVELTEAKAEVDSACADARSGELRKRYGADTLRCAREAAKEAYAVLVREKKSISASVSEAEKMVSGCTCTVNLALWCPRAQNKALRRSDGVGHCFLFVDFVLSLVVGVHVLHDHEPGRDEWRRMGQTIYVSVAIKRKALHSVSQQERILFVWKALLCVMTDVQQYAYQPKVVV